MNRNMRIGLTIVAIVAALSLGSCDALETFFDTAPTARLTITDGDSSPCNEEEIEITAITTDKDRDTITLSWYIDDEVVEDLDSEKIYFTPRGYTSDTKVTISVVADDGKGKTAKASLTVNAIARSTIYVINKSGAAVSMFKSCYYGSTSYSSDWFGGSYLANGKYTWFYDGDPGNYGYAWLYGGVSGSIASVAMQNGRPKYLTITGSTATVTAVKPALSESQVPLSSLSASRNEKQALSD